MHALAHAFGPHLTELDAHALGGLVCGVDGREHLLHGETPYRNVLRAQIIDEEKL